MCVLKRDSERAREQEMEEKWNNQSEQKSLNRSVLCCSTSTLQSVNFIVWDMSASTSSFDYTTTTITTTTVAAAATAAAATAAAATAAAATATGDDEQECERFNNCFRLYYFRTCQQTKSRSPSERTDLYVVSNRRRRRRRLCVFVQCGLIHTDDQKITQNCSRKIQNKKSFNKSIEN